MPFTKLEDLNNTGVEDILSYPLTGDYFFWAKILLGLFFIIGFTAYFEERARLGKANFLASFAVSSIAVIVLSFIGSLFKIVTTEIFTGVFVLGAIIIFIWFVKED